VSLIFREPRLLARDKPPVRYRDDRIFLVACDDHYAPKQYFGFFDMRRIRIIVAAAEDNRSAPRHALDRLRKQRKDMKLRARDECWLVLDTDHHLEDNHRPNFIELIREAEKDRIHVALSRPCFEFWLLLHHENWQGASALARCGDVETRLRSAVGEYNKTELKREHFVNGSVEAATLRAERLDASVAGGHLPAGPTTRIYKLIRAIVAKALPADLPRELRQLSTQNP
jgi:hypothetical protein